MELRKIQRLHTSVSCKNFVQCIDFFVQIEYNNNIILLELIIWQAQHQTLALEWTLT